MSLLPGLLNANHRPVENLGPPDYQIPRPQLSIWQRLMGQNEENHVKNAQVILNGAAAAMGRHASQEEVNALCEINYKQYYTTALMVPLGVAISGYLSWKGRRTFRFPLYQPKFTKFNPHVFPSERRPILYGGQANVVWHSVRISAYTLFAVFSGAPLLASYATSVAIATAARDDRLAQFRQDMKPGKLVELNADQMSLNTLRHNRQIVSTGISKMESQMAQIPSEEQLRRQYNPGQAEQKINASRQQKEMMMQHLEEYRKIIAVLDEKIAQKQGQSADDSASQNQDYEALNASRSVDGARPEFAAPREAPAPAPERSGWGWGKQSSTSQQQGWSKDDSDGLGDDDASPIAPAARSVPQSASPAAGGSAWDRLRQSSQKPAKPSGEAENYGDGYSYDRAEEESASEKTKAQKEFDAMLERERRGTAGENSGRRGGW